MANNNINLITADSIEELVKQVGKTVSPEQAKILEYNLGEGVKQHKIDLLTKDTGKTELQKANTRTLIENAPTLAAVISDVRAKLPAGYGLSYAYDSISNTFKIYTNYDQKNIGKPLSIDFEDLTGITGGKIRRGTQTTVLSRNLNNQTMLTSAGVLGLQKLAQSLADNQSRLTTHLNAYSSLKIASPNDTRALSMLANKIEKSERYFLKLTNQLARPGENFVGDASHIYKTQNPEYLKAVEQTISYGHLISDLFDQTNIKKLLNDNNLSSKNVIMRIKNNLLAQADISKGIPAVIAKLPAFKQLAKTLQDFSSIGLSINELNDEAYGKGLISGVPTSSSVKYGAGRQRQQAANYGTLSKAATALRKDRLSKLNIKKNPSELGYFVGFGSAKDLRAAGVKTATEEGGIYITPQAAKEMEKINTAEKKFSQASIDAHYQKQLQRSKGIISKTLKTLGISPEAYEAMTPKDYSRFISLYESSGNEKGVAKMTRLRKETELYKQLLDPSRFTQEYLYSSIMKVPFDINRNPNAYKDMKVFKDSEKDLIKGIVSQNISFGSGFKLIGDRVRDAGGLLDSSSLTKSAQLFGIDPSLLSGVKVVGDKVKPRKAADFIFEPAKELLEFLQDYSGLSGDEFNKRFLSTNSPLSKIYSYDSSKQRLVENESKFQDFVNKGQIENLATSFLQFFKDIDNFTKVILDGNKDIEQWQKVARGITGNIKEVTDADGNKAYQFERVLGYARLMPMQMVEYGMPSSTKAKLDYRGQNAMENIAAMAGVKSGLLAQYFQPSAQQKAEADRQKVFLGKMLKAYSDSSVLFGNGKSTKGFYNKDGGYLTVGFGAQYDIDLSGQNTVLPEYDAATGQITKESYNNSAIKYVGETFRNKIAEVLGVKPSQLSKKTLDKYTLYMDLSNGDLPFQPVTSENITSTGKKVVLESRALPLHLTGTYGDVSNQLGRSAWSIMNNVVASNYLAKNAVKTPQVMQEVETYKNSIGAGINSYLAELMGPVYDPKNEQYKKTHSIPVKGAIWGVNKPASFEQYEDTSKAVAYMSKDAAVQMLQEHFGNKNIKTLNDVFKTVTGSESAFKNYQEFSNALIGYLMDPKNEHGLMGFLDRFPNSTGQDVRLVEWKINKALEGTDIQMSRGLSKLVNGDFDGDRILSAIFGFKNKADLELFKSLYNPEIRNKMLQASDYAVASLENKMKKGEDVTDNTVLTEKTLKD